MMMIIKSKIAIQVTSSELVTGKGPILNNFSAAIEICINDYILKKLLKIKDIIGFCSDLKVTFSIDRMGFNRRSSIAVFDL